MKGRSYLPTVRLNGNYCLTSRINFLAFDSSANGTRAISCIGGPPVSDQVLSRKTGWKPWSTGHMPHAIIRAGNGRRHEVDFEDAEIRIEVYSSDETVEILAKQSTTSRRQLLLNIPKHLFSSALGAAALQKGTPEPRRA
jgi:hypothetical protein